MRGRRQVHDFFYPGGSQLIEDYTTFYSLKIGKTMSMQAKSVIQRLQTKPRTTSPTRTRPSGPKAKTFQVLKQQYSNIPHFGTLMVLSSLRSRRQDLNYTSRRCTGALRISPLYFKRGPPRVCIPKSKSTGKTRTRTSPSIASARRRQTTLRRC